MSKNENFIVCTKREIYKNSHKFFFIFKNIFKKWEFIGLTRGDQGRKFWGYLNTGRKICIVSEQHF